MGEEDRWAMSHAEEDGQPVLLRFRSDLPVKETTRFPFLISILWIYDGSKNGGMPDDRTLAMMDRVEDSLDWIDESGEAFLLAAGARKNRRAWAWATHNRRPSTAPRKCPP